MAQTSPIDPDDPGYAGQRHYTARFLRIYDPLVLGFFARAVWRCPTPRLVAHYRRHVGRRHLDIGPGTGYFLERGRLAAGARVTLVDPNPNVLAHASSRLAHLRPATIAADVRKPLPVEAAFDSAALNYVLHCLPGPQARKRGAVANVAAALRADGVLFGATVLGTPALHTRLSRAALRANNRRGIFDNLSDTEAGLSAILEAAFDAVEIDLVGSVAVFTARRPRRAPEPRVSPGGRPQGGSQI